MKIDRVCICCDKQLKSVLEGEDRFSLPPDDGIVLTTTGNYGSTVFDSIRGDRLEMYLCDACLREEIDFGHVYLVKNVAKAEEAVKATLRNIHYD